MSHPYADEKGVFKNKLGITDAAALKAAEYSLTSRRMLELETGRAQLPNQGFGLDKLRSIHGHLFQDVYGWAGQVRTTHSSKRAENGMVSVFEAPEKIVSSWAALAEKSAAFVADHGRPTNELREQLVTIYAEANRIHAFPEGNGRSLQTFMKHLAREQGLDLDFVRTTPRDWNLASALSGTFGLPFERVHIIRQPSDIEPLRKVFADIVRPARALAFDRLSEEQACAKHPELLGAYAGLRAIEKRAASGVADKPNTVEGYMKEVRAAFVKLLDEGRPLEHLRTPQRQTEGRDR